MSGSARVREGNKRVISKRKNVERLRERVELQGCKRCGAGTARKGAKLKYLESDHYHQ